MPSDYVEEFGKRAEELRAIAELVHDRRNRETLLKCAKDYENLAAQYERASAQGGKFYYPPIAFQAGFTALSPMANPHQSQPVTGQSSASASSGSSTPGRDGS